jgi:hypothetical protein
VSSPTKVMIVVGTVLALFGATGSASAQTGPAAPTLPPPGGGDVFYVADDMGPSPIAPPEFIGFVDIEAEHGGKTVAGAPFTATFSTQTSQTLADGNRIQRTTTGTLARDSQGRTRRDMTFTGIGPLATSGNPSRVSMINDPVAGTHYILDLDKKIAHQLGPHGGQGHKHSHLGGTASATMPDDPDVTTSSLGTQTIGGVAVEGTHTTRTIPAEAIGNEKPIVITVDRWYSADLQTVVKTIRSDPRMGETIMQLTEIKRQEPDASLFQVPADYTIKTGGPKQHVKPLSD